MRKQLSLFLALTFAVMLVPAIPVFIKDKSSADAAEKPGFSSQSEPEIPSATSPPAVPDRFYKVLDVSTGEVIEVSVLDYIIGAVCAEMPASFEVEALKAQAVAAHTYAERQKLRELTEPTADLKGAYFSNDTSKYQGYFTAEQAKNYYGENFDAYYGKISDAVNEVAGYIMTYRDEPIVSAFHSMSSGKTESAENVWGSHLDYLVPVESEADKLAPKYLEEVNCTPEAAKYQLERAFGSIKLSGDFKDWFEIIRRSDSGTVLEVRAGDKTVSGNELRAALALRSPTFDIEYTDSDIVFKTRGYGHGVGMSQYGANAMAAEGKTWQEILLHYYPNVTVSEAI